MSTQLTQRVHNFSAGPAALPLSVLEKAQTDLLCLPGAGASILEISHRSPNFVDIMNSAQHRLRQLLAISDDYEVLLLQGGSRLQFSMTAMNLMGDSSTPADYVITGSWGSKALDEARKEGDVRAIWSGDPDFNALPDWSSLDFNAEAPYSYITSNETIQGVQFPTDLDSPSPLVCDSSSDFLSRPIPIHKYGLVYACAQKNAGPAGVTVVVLRKDLMDRASDSLPGYLNYRSHAKANSMYNTPPTFAVYLLDLVCQWLQEEMGGLVKMHERNERKAQDVYQIIDESDGFYVGHAAPSARSLMNVTFRLADSELEAKFLSQATDHGLEGLKGHRSVGGVRASIYNAMTIEGIAALCQYMRDFMTTNG